jgi:hypothetical protein
MKYKQDIRKRAGLIVDFPFSIDILRKEAASSKIVLFWFRSRGMRQH